MKILLTGASGFIAGRIAEDLCKKNYEVICLLRSDPSDELRKKLKGAEIAVGSLQNPVFLKKHCAGVDVIVHCAGLAGTWGKREDFEEANVQLTKRLAEAASQCDVKKWIQLSTPSIYFNFKDQFDIKEEFLPDEFSSFYAETKYEADQFLLSSKDFKTIALRPRFVLGRGDNQIIPRMLRFMKMGFYPLVGEGNHQIDFTNVSNISKAVELAINAPDEAWGEIYNISNGSPAVFTELVGELQRRVHQKVKILRIPREITMKVAKTFQRIEKLSGRYQAKWLHPVEVGVMTKSMTLNIDKAKEKLGYIPEGSFKSALNEFFS